jgi:hypothetical protein
LTSNSSAQNIALAITDRRIYGVLYQRMGKLFSMKVGNADPVKGETVIAIFESNAYFLAFTPSRGVVRGKPYLIANAEALSVNDFE